MSKYLFTVLLMLTAEFYKPARGAELITNETVAIQWLEEFDERIMELYAGYGEAVWNYYTNLTDENYAKQLVYIKEGAVFSKEVAEEVAQFAWRNFSADVKRQFSAVAYIGIAVLSEEKVEREAEVHAHMMEVYSKGAVCERPGHPEDACFPLNPDLDEIMAKSRDWDELKWAWQGWRNATGRHIKHNYTENIALHNEAARMEGLDDQGARLKSYYETDTFADDVADLWQTVKPLYVQLHAYVRRQLQKIYSDHDFPATGHIPAHLLGNMWAQQWNNLYDDIVPYKGKEPIDITQALIDQNYTALDIVELSDEFFQSLGLIPMPQSFYDDSMFVKPTDGRQVVCHASAWDFVNGKDFRIKQCTEITHEWLLTTHHEMGHIQYFLQYKDLPVVYKGGANPGFHEAVGDTLALSVSTPTHLKEIGLLDNVNQDPESEINYLFYMALEKIAFLPFGYLVDQWRWDVYAGKTEPDQYTEAWAKLRCKHQGISPPVMRASDDFDPGAKFHVPNNTPYIRYFVSFVIQFQFHKSLCEAANFDGPLHHCDIYRSQEAGQKLGDMLKLGASKPWPEAMEQIAGTRKMDAGPLVEYFEPLIDWLKEQNEGYDIGWDEDCPFGTFPHNVRPNMAPRLQAVWLLTMLAAALAAMLVF